MLLNLHIYDVSLLGVKFSFSGQGPILSFGFQMSNNWYGRTRSVESRGAKVLHIIKNRDDGSH